MRKSLGVIAAAVLWFALLACSLVPRAPSYRVATAENAYEFHHGRYERLCGPKAPRPVPFECKATEDLLNALYDDLKDERAGAQAALHRGGGLPLQLKAIRKDEAALEKSALWRHLK